MVRSFRLLHNAIAPGKATATTENSRVPPDADHLIGTYWQIKIDGVLRDNFLFSSARRAAEQAKRLIDGRAE
jgi:hypothetical protein